MCIRDSPTVVSSVAAVLLSQPFACDVTMDPFLSLLATTDNKICCSQKTETLLFQYDIQIDLS